MKDLVVLVADKNMEFLMRGLLPKIPTIEKTSDFSFDIQVHQYRDPGIYNEADDFLRSFTESYRFAIAMLDHQGSGRENMSREEIENNISLKLSQTGWEGRHVVICISPELENWIWVNETRLQDVMAWDESTGLYEWLDQQNWKPLLQPKPQQPKEAFEAALKQCKTPRSSSIYKELANKASYKNCTDAAFFKLINQLQAWFG